ncbi:H-2 class I histocompatibility antigen, Q10 alpha chain-like [Erinaceus europaeus]|uniref:H-2 class I histocompatibility antigen, Q10 alpha chain-like n=1 Tax=Erinaceus europaeus TaxID=9365 RepID=A0A1S3WH92_ERIEU|nr:H-2 class I histocompatibility antigen, Q10 alpha chain-like [Erinaceus europaeus]
MSGGAWLLTVRGLAGVTWRSCATSAGVRFAGPRRYPKFGLQLHRPQAAGDRRRQTPRQLFLWSSARLAAWDPRDPRDPRDLPGPRSACTWLLLLSLLLSLGPRAAAESPWGLPPVEDGSASSAKKLMAELASLKLENTSWPGGRHTLHYHYLFLSESGPNLPLFLAVGYMNDQPFIRFDSRVGKAEPCALWMAAVESWYWDTETEKQRGWKEVQKVEMKRVMAYHNHSSGTHTTQRMFGCEIKKDGKISGFWQFGYDGQDHLTLDLENLSWVSANSVALQKKRFLERQRCYAEYNKAYLSSLCLLSLRRYLELGGLNLTRREPPTVQVTRHLAQDGGAILRCWARGFYPRDISVSWWVGEEELSQETEWVETRPSGDGTYQTWMAVRVLEKKSSYTCWVQHSGLNYTLTETWESPSLGGLSALVIPFGLIVVAIVMFWRWFQARKKETSQQSPGREPA